LKPELTNKLVHIPQHNLLIHPARSTSREATPARLPTSMASPIYKTERVTSVRMSFRCSGFICPWCWNSH